MCMAGAVPDATLRRTGNGLTAPIHDRMPVIVLRDSYPHLVGSDERGHRAVEGADCVLAGRRMEAHTVSKAVSNARSESADLIQPTTEGALARASNAQTMSDR